MSNNSNYSNNNSNNYSNKSIIIITFNFNILLFNCSYLLIALNKPSCVLVYFLL